MGIKDAMFDGKSEKGRRFFMNMLNWLDNPNRTKYNNPEKLLAGSEIHEGQNVLEIGCGSGFFTLPAAKIMGETGHIHAIDLHPVAVEETQKKVDAAGLTNVTVKKDDAMNCSFEDSTFDLVLLYGVVPAPVISMKDISKEIYRVLKPGGIYAIWTMVPFWSPRVALKHCPFEKLKKINSVFRLRKI